MFKNKTHYQDDKTGSIKVSQAFNQFHFKNKTQGIAIKFVTQGTEYYTLNNRTIELRPGQFAILPYEENYHVYGSKGKHTHGLCIDIKPDLLNKLSNPRDTDALPLFTPYHCSGSTRIGQKITSLQTLNKNAKYATHYLQEVSEALAQFSDEISTLDKVIAKDSKKHSTRQLLITKLLYSREYICRNFHKKISLDELARHTALSKFHLARLFKRCFGLTPLAMQEQYRMHKAKELLTSNWASITTIAHSLGYTDLAAFSNSFKRYWHCPPSHFRTN